MDRKFPSRRMGRGGLISWPSRSPHLSPCDYFYESISKDIVYHQHLETISELKREIRIFKRSIDRDMLRKLDKIHGQASKLCIQRTTTTF